SDIPAEKFGGCQCETSHAESILYQILNEESHCSCVDERSWLKKPGATCSRASGVLLKMSTFVRNLPSFYHNWAPPFVLGLAQEGVDFDLREVLGPSLLKKILIQSSTASSEPGSSSLGTSLAEVQKIKNLLWKFWDLDISVREYAYLKGIILFHSGKSASCSTGAVLAFKVVWMMIHHATKARPQPLRFAWILQLITSLHDIDADAIEELFFRSILGEATLNEVLLVNLCIKPDWL
uniref:NR LBD domain-containing protein n=1 Tax=Anas zonorhyncha TaxID=75864 RepID=A0A8B9V7M9_9AVES